MALRLTLQALLLGFIGLAQAFSLHRRSVLSHSSVLYSPYTSASICLLQRTDLDGATDSLLHRPSGSPRGGGRSLAALGACRRNNKEEKAERNRIYARRFLRKDGSSGRSATREAKRAALDAKVSRFAQGLFQVTTDKDDPEDKADKNVLFGI